MAETASSSAVKSQRNQAIDIFRGATIVLMIFYTVTGVLSDQLPYFAAHNIANNFHPGDFILPMFLFASGMSLVFFEKKRNKISASEYYKIVIKRVAQLVAISVGISFLNSCGLIFMDEIMLNMLLFVPSLYLARYSDKVLLSICAVIVGLHFGLQQAGLLPDYVHVAYLGGFRGAIWYLPVMLGGILCARNQERIAPFAFAFGATTIALTYFSMPYKMNLYPSFITLSVAWCFLFFELAKLVHSDVLVYYGRTPLRFWVFQMLLFAVPARMYCLSQGRVSPVGIDPGKALLYGLAAIIVAGGLSRVYDLHRAVYAYLRSQEKKPAPSPIAITDPTVS